MSYEEFRNQVKENILSYLPGKFSGARVMIEEGSGNNGQKFYSVLIKRPEDRIIPSIHLDDYYRMYQNGRDMEEILASIANIHRQHLEDGPQLLPFQLNDYESIKDRLYVTVLNRNNDSYLENAVCRDVPETDITAVVRVLCMSGKTGETASFMVKENMLAMWGVDSDSVYDRALGNTEKLFEPLMMNMCDILFPEEPEERRGEEPETAINDWEILDGELYVLSNTGRLNGAAAILYPDLLQKIGEATKSRFFLVPSSIHEWILRKDDGIMDSKQMQRMVLEVNRTQLEPEEVLSDQVYEYDYRERKLTMATSPEQTKELLEQMKEEGWKWDFLTEGEDEWEDELCMEE